MSARVLQLRLTAELWEALEDAAGRLGVTRTEIGRGALIGYLLKEPNGTQAPVDTRTLPDPGVTDGVAPRALRATCQHPVNRRIGRTCMLCGIVLGGAKL